MHVVVIFIHLGGYHAARLRAAYAACKRKGWNFTAIQAISTTQQHPWGDMEQQITFPLKTLLAENTRHLYTDERQWSVVAAAELPPLLDNLQPDIVVIPGWGFPISRAGLTWSRRHNSIAIVMSESKWDDEPRQWWKEKFKSWLYVSKFDGAIVGGELHRDYLVKLGIPKNRIFIGYDAVDNEYFSLGAKAASQNPSAARQRQPKIPSRPYFLSVTRLIERKNVSRLVAAFADYRQKIGEDEAWDMVICGNGQEETPIRNFIHTNKLDNCVHLPGFITYQQITDWYGLANAFVHPALQEQWGLVLNEACATGLPILSSCTVGAAYELVKNTQNGFLFAPDNQQDITRALLAVHKLELNSRRQMGQLSKQIVANYAPEKFADGLLSAIQVALIHRNEIIN